MYCGPFFSVYSSRDDKEIIQYQMLNPTNDRGISTMDAFSITLCHFILLKVEGMKDTFRPCQSMLLLSFRSFSNFLAPSSSFALCRLAIAPSSRAFFFLHFLSTQQEANNPQPFSLWINWMQNVTAFYLTNSLTIPELIIVAWKLENDWSRCYFLLSVP